MSRRRSPSDLFGLLGLAQRAGAVARGGDATRKAIRAGKARLVILADDASPAQLEKIQRAMGQRALARGTVPSQVQLGGALGAGPLSAVAVTNASFAAQVSRALQAADETIVEPKPR